MKFDDAFEALIGHEGGYSNNPADPGGETMYGVTARVARANGYTGDMKALALDSAKAIARKEYWDSAKCDSLPDSIRFDIFDAAYNSGVKQSIKWLQRAAKCADDGVIGPATISAASSIAPDLLLRRFNGHRLQFMTDLAAWPSFGRGWARRISTNLLR